MTNSIKHFFLYLFAICIFFGGTSKSFAYFLLGCLFSYYWFFWEVFYIFWVHVFVRYMNYKYFLTVCDISFHSINSIFQIEEILNFSEVQFIHFFLLWIVLLVSYLRNLNIIQIHKDFLFFFPVFSCGCFIVVGLIFSLWSILS